MQPYKVEVPFQKRKLESERVMAKYPGRIPVVAEPGQKASDMFKDNPHIHTKNRKYLVPADVTVGQFVYILRTRFKLSSEQAMFIFVNNLMPPTSVLMSALYQQHADEDGFLYVSYAGENVFG